MSVNSQDIACSHKTKNINTQQHHRTTNVSPVMIPMVSQSRTTRSCLMKKKNSKNIRTTKPEKEVTFGTQLTIREYPIIMGDNPAAHGCPITLGWKVLAENKRNFELYEYARANLRVHGKKKLFLSIPRRSQLLLDAGYTQDQIVKRALEMAELQHLRQLSIQDGKGGGLLAKNFLKGFNLMTLGVVGTTPPSAAAAPRRAAPPRKSLTARSA